MPKFGAPAARRLDTYNGGEGAALLRFVYAGARDGGGAEQAGGSGQASEGGRKVAPGRGGRSGGRVDDQLPARRSSAGWGAERGEAAAAARPPGRSGVGGGWRRAGEEEEQAN
ncbi:hypothetical protein ZWY2020_045074 [Hordeum vulgare]|nr:hypothetical protein ZWY2020_045074 [Hordeum vulgare]